MTDAEAGDQGVNRPDLDSLAPAQIAQFCGLDMIVDMGASTGNRENDLMILFRAVGPWNP